MAPALDRQRRVQGVRDRAEAASRGERTQAKGFVPCTTHWWIEGHDYLGRLAIRHRLSDTLFERGGHIGYDRPSARRRGHATEMLAAARPLANALAIDPALVTCDTTNMASRKVIERNGGVLEDQRAGKLRYWMSTSAH